MFGFESRWLGALAIGLLAAGGAALIGAAPPFPHPQAGWSGAFIPSWSISTGMANSAVPGERPPRHDDPGKPGRAQKAGIIGTPAFFLRLTVPETSAVESVKMLRGAQPYSRFREVIESFLSSRQD